MRNRPELNLIVAESGRDGVLMAQNNLLSLILLDRQLPDMPGNDVLRELKTSPVTAAIPVIVLSGDSSVDKADEMIGEGAAAYVEKPFDIHHLLAMIDKFCSPPTVPPVDV